MTPATTSSRRSATRWFVADALPVTPTGKVQKFRLADLVGTDQLRELTP